MRDALEGDLGQAPRRLRLLDLSDERRLDGFGAGAIGAQPIGLGRELIEAGAQGLAVGRHTTQFALAALDGVAQRAQLAAHLRRRSRRPRAAIVGRGERLGEARPLAGEGIFLGGQRFGLGGDTVERGVDLDELLAQARGVGFEVGDDAGVEQLAMVALERALALGEDAGQAARPFPQLLHMHQAIADVALAAGRQLRLEGHDRRCRAWPVPT